MTLKINNVIKTMILSLVCITSTVSFYADELQDKSNKYLGELPYILNNHAQKITKLHDIYKKSKNDEEKKKLENERDAMTKEFKETFSEYIKTEPLKDTKLPFKVVSKNLPFEVISVKVDRLTLGTTYFKIQVKTNQDIREPDGKLSQRIYIHFAAVDSEDKIIPHTWNWGYSRGGTDFKAGIISDSQGHWNANRVQNMKDFSYIQIMSKADYKKMKISQRNK